MIDRETLYLIAALITVLGAVLAVLKWGRQAVNWAWHRVTRYRPSVPRETMRIVAEGRGLRWHMGSVSGQPAMQVVSDWHLTNITDKPVYVLGVRILQPATEGVILLRHPQGRAYGGHPIPPRDTTDARADFWVQPPVRKVGEDFKATVIFVDQYGNQHRAKNVLFKGPKPSEPKKTEPPKEAIHAIADPIERQVVAVLKDEVNRYQQCGRRVGGLGSVQTTYRGRTMTGVGTDWRQADSPRRQSIAPDPKAASIDSDNAAALVRMWQQLPSEEEKERFVNALLNRLKRETEYSPIGYLIVLVLFRVGKLREAFQVAKRDLQNDGTLAFSEVLRLLDGLLRLEHPSFSAEMLDAVDTFLDGVQEHPFAIPERVTAIRASQVATVHRDQ